MHRFDLDETLDKSGTDYLFVASRPLGEAVKGKPYVYHIVVKSKRGGVSYKLESGPKGMQVSKDGQLTWDVPAACADAEVDVLLTIADLTGREFFHTFSLVVRDGGDSPVGPECRIERPGEEKKEPARDKVPRAALQIKPAALKKDREELLLSSAVTDICAGGDGRYLILYLRKECKLAVFDVNEAKIVRFLSLAEDHVRFAAGRDALIVALPDSNVLHAGA